MFSLSSRRRRVTGGIASLVAALGVAAPAMASDPPVVEADASSPNIGYSWGAAGSDVDSTAIHFTRKAG